MRVSQRNGREMKLHQSNVPLLPRSFAVWGVAARKFPPFPRAWNAIIIYLRGNLGLKVNGGGPEKHMAGLEKQRELRYDKRYRADFSRTSDFANVSATLLALILINRYSEAECVMRASYPWNGNFLENSGGIITPLRPC